MNDCLHDSDLLELSNESLASFEKRVGEIPSNLCAPFHTEARVLETQLVSIYKVVVMATKRQDDLQEIANCWECMVNVCDAFAKQLRKLTDAHPYCGAEQYYDRVLELRSKCSRLQKMHS